MASQVWRCRTELTNGKTETAIRGRQRLGISQMQGDIRSRPVAFAFQRKAGAIIPTDTAVTDHDGTGSSLWWRSNVGIRAVVLLPNGLIILYTGIQAGSDAHWFSGIMPHTERASFVAGREQSIRVQGQRRYRNS